jgi:hypothetical protein
VTPIRRAEACDRVITCATAGGDDDMR